MEIKNSIKESIVYTYNQDNYKENRLSLLTVETSKGLGFDSTILLSATN